MNWNEIQPDGTVLKPAPGMLVEMLTNEHLGHIGACGKWVIIPPEPNHGVMRINQLTNFKMYSTPLAPAPTPGGLWAALSQLPGADVAAAGDAIWIPLARGEIWIHREDRYGSIASGYDPGHITHNTAHETQQCLAQYIALLAYCAQPGWEVTL